MNANAAEIWDQLWEKEGDDSWRKDRMANVYDRIVDLIPTTPVCDWSVFDIGGGIGLLGEKLKEKGLNIWVLDHSDIAVKMSRDRGLNARRFDLLTDDLDVQANDICVGTEILEHLSEENRSRLLEATKSNRCYWSVPNNRLGPDEELQHTTKWTALEFLNYMKSFYHHVRVECIDDYLLAVCGFEKNFTLSVCSPARDEEADIERMLASFRGVADEIVIGIDPRSEDRTEEIARQYADIVFTLEDPTQGEVHEKGVHFANIRNQCMEKCHGDWIFMTEAHESLCDGQDVLLNFANGMVGHVGVIFVTRSGQGQEWLFPWLCRNDKRIRYFRATHNMLEWPKSVDTRHLRQIKTLHKRSKNNAVTRSAQRKVQNRKSLMEDWVVDKSTSSLFYLAQEWRTYDPERAEKCFEKFLATEKKRGGIRYQAKLILAQMYVKKNDLSKARELLTTCSADDWMRTEHLVWLGDLAWEQDYVEEALQWYRFAGTRFKETPLSMFWYDVSMYTYILAQRLAMAFACCKRFKEAELWAERVVETLPEDSPEILKEEAKNNLLKIKEINND